jgi:DNA-binding CsgD family transcriptional regulator
MKNSRKIYFLITLLLVTSSSWPNGLSYAISESGISKIDTRYFKVYESNSLDSVINNQTKEINIRNLTSLEPFKSYWIRFDITNEIEAEKFVLNIDQSISNLTLYNLSNLWFVSKAGTHVPYSNRECKSTKKYHVSFSIEKNSSTTLLLNFYNSYDAKIKLDCFDIAPKNYYEAKIYKRDIFQGFFHGLTLVLLVIATILFFIRKKKFYLFYNLYLLFQVISCLYFSNYTEIFLFPNSPKYDLILYSTLNIASVSYMYFIYSFCRQTYKKGHWLNSLLISAIVVYSLSVLVSIFISIFDYSLFMLISDCLQLSGIIIVVIMNVTFFRQNQKYLQYIAIGSLFMLIGCFVTLVFSYGKITIENTVYLQIGLAIEFSFFLVAMQQNYRELNLVKHITIINNLKRENEKVLQEYKINKLKLENSDKEKTVELNAQEMFKLNQSIKYFYSNIKRLKEEYTEDNEHVLSEIKLLVKDMQILSAYKEIKTNEEQFDKKNKEFYLKLIDLHPKLSPNEQKLCALLRENFSSQEIADQLSKERNTVDVARYRLRKKLEIPTKTNIVSYLQSI